MLTGPFYPVVSSMVHENASEAWGEIMEIPLGIVFMAWWMAIAIWACRDRQGHDRRTLLGLEALEWVVRLREIAESDELEIEFTPGIWELKDQVNTMIEILEDKIENAKTDASRNKLIEHVRLLRFAITSRKVTFADDVFRGIGEVYDQVYKKPGYSE